jgi:alkylhydroperoxidase family enzyme
MIRWLMKRGVGAFERKWNYDASYLRAIIDASPRAAWLFSRVARLGTFRRGVPVDAWTAAAIVAVRQEDCGPCTQLGVAMAESAGVDPKVLRAVLTENSEAMPPDVALAWRFARATLAHDAAADELRDAIVERWGAVAVVSLAFAMAAARIYPTVKYAMGHGQACTRVVVAGAPVAFDHAVASGHRG